MEGQQRVCTLEDHTSSLQTKGLTLTARTWAQAGTLHAVEGRQRLCGLGDHMSSLQTKAGSYGLALSAQARCMRARGGSACAARASAGG